MTDSHGTGLGKGSCSPPVWLAVGVTGSRARSRSTRSSTSASSRGASGRNGKSASQRLLAFFLPVANQVPHMAAMMPPGTRVVTVELKGEFMDLLGDARFRTIRMR